MYFFHVNFASKKAEKDLNFLKEFNFDSRKINDKVVIGLSATSHFQKYQTLKQRDEKELDDVTFTEKDMRNENGKPFHIIIWNRRSGPPGRKADPETCDANVSCEITFITEDYVKADAIVMPAQMQINSKNLPEAR